jgi:hypothetical protein
MIPPIGTFDYKAEFTKEGFGDSDIELFGADYSGHRRQRLVGLNPKIRFWNDRLVIVAAEQPNSTVRNVSFGIGDAIRLAARPGDQLYLKRTGAGGIGMSVLRRQELILAVGAVRAMPLGSELKVRVHPRSEDSIWDDHATDTWLQFDIRNQSLTLREREASEIEGYYIYVERCWEYGIPGTDECVSICAADDLKMRISAMRSAILLANADLKTVSWDCTEHFTTL